MRFLQLSDSAHRANRRPTRAFTLLEVLIAVVTFAIVLAAINTVFYSALRLRNKTTQAIERALPRQHTLAIVKHDLEGIVPPGGVLAGALKSGTGASTALPATGTMLGANPEDGPEIYTNVGLVDDASPWGEVQRVTYYLRAPTNRVAAAGQDLIRAVTRNLLATIEEEPTEQWLMGNVERIEFLFYSGTDWRDSWDSTTEESVLPKAIKFRIHLAEDESERQPGKRLEPESPIELVVPIIVQARTNQTQTTGGQP